MIRRTLALLVLATAGVSAQDATLEYRVKAAYLFNFARYVEWPVTAPADAPLTLCVAGRNPFGSSLEETVRGERIDNRPIVVRVILEPEVGCHVMFVPRGSAESAYLRATRGSPILTVGESDDFITQGGIIRFVIEGTSVRFEIDTEAAQHANLRISSRLLRLARGRP